MTSMSTEERSTIRDRAGGVFSVSCKTGTPATSSAPQSIAGTAVKFVCADDPATTERVAGGAMSNKGSALQEDVKRLYLVDRLINRDAIGQRTI